MEIQISPGEALDRLTILEIKEKEITDSDRRAHVQHEMTLYTKVLPMKETYSTLYALLLFVNKRIWDLTNIVKTLPVTAPNYAQLAYEIFELNQQRFRLKTAINRATVATIQEQKSYSPLTLCVEYSTITSDDIADIVYYFLNNYTFMIKTTHYHPICTHLMIPILSPESDIQSILPPAIDKMTEYYTQLYRMFKPIVYISGGLFGDFIHQLSIVCEKYNDTGRKGILLITDKVGDTESFNVQRTYRDMYDILMKQEYIQDFICR
jgi:hypothetical protein